MAEPTDSRRDGVRHAAAGSPTPGDPLPEQARLRAILDTTSDAFVGMSEDGLVTEWNPAAESMFGWTAAEALGRPLAELILPEQGRRAHDAGVARFLATGVRRLPTGPVDVAGVHRDGHELRLELVMSAMPTDDGWHFYAFLRDVTARRQSEERLAVLAQTVACSADALYSTDLDGVITSWNAAAVRLYGWPAAEAIGSPQQRVVPEDRLDEMLALEELAVGSRRPQHVRTQRLTKDGDRVDVALSLAPLLDHAGSHVGFTKSARDIGERLRVDQRLRRSEELFRSVFEASLVGMTLTGVDGRLVRVNAVFADMLGRSPEELVGMTDKELTHPRHRVRVPEVARTLAGDINGFAIEKCYARKDGSEVWVQLSTALVRDDSGRPSHFATQMVDVTEQRRARRERDTREQMLQEVIANSQSLIYVKDLDGRYLLVNEQFQRAFRVTEAELVGKDDTYLAPARATEWRRNDVRAQQERFHVAEVSDGPSGRSYYDSVKFPLRDADGYVYATCGMSLDVTASRAAAVALTEARDAALAATAAKSAFLATMSHEIRTPLNAVIGMTDLLLDTELDGTQREFAHTVQSSGEALLGVINNILDFSKIESGQLELDSHPFVLEDCIDGALALVAVAAQAKGVELVADLDYSCPLLVGDAGRLQQILVNLLSNAVKFTAHGEVVLTARTWPHGSDDDGPVQLDISVADTGIGIPADRIDRLFHAFSQVDSSTTRLYGGTGLGLAITARLAEAMGGRVTVSSEPGVGSRFTVSVQLTAARERRPAVDEALSGVLRDRTVLVVDDNVTNRRVLRLQLESWGAGCVDVGRPEEALALVAGGHTFDMAILDMQMPGMDGQQLATALREHPSARDLPMVMLTSLQSRPLLAGADTFAAVLSKPVKSRQLLKILSQCLVTSAYRRPDAPARRRRDDLPAVARPGALRILLAEDNPVNQQVAQLMLRRLGHEVDIVGSGDQAVAAVLQEAYDVVLMDVQMPRLDGLQAAEQIRAAVGVRHQPHIVALTANAMAEDRVACLRAGMDDYLAKPVRAGDLRDVLGRLPAQRRARPAAAVHPVRDEATAERVDTVRRRLEELAGHDPDEDRALFAQLLASFTDRLPDVLRDLRLAADQGDAGAVERHAHGLKGSAANLGARHLAAASALVEAEARNGCASLPEEMQQLRDEVDRTIRAITTLTWD